MLGNAGYIVGLSMSMFLAACSKGNGESNCSFTIDVSDRRVEFRDATGDGVHIYQVHSDGATTVAAVGQSALSINGVELPPCGYNYHVTSSGWELEIIYLDISDGSLDEISQQVELIVQTVLAASGLPEDQFTYDMSGMDGEHMEATEMVTHSDIPQLLLRYSSKYIVRGKPKLELRLAYVGVDDESGWESVIDIDQDPDVVGD